MLKRTLYVIKCSEFHKIGMTSDLVEYRMKYMQIGNPYEMEIIATYQGDNIPYKEKELHKLFSSKKERGEWFRLDEVDLEVISDFMIKE